MLFINKKIGENRLNNKDLEKIRSFVIKYNLENLRSWVARKIEKNLIFKK